ncbi:MAG: Flp pilus assembly complex ATPase component, partial [Methanocellales archaeon]|nr:Flp pilus assembly complex ATPase component [Methanocellales archaeon]
RGELEGAQILIPEAVITELEAQANKGRDIGFSGLDELKKLNEMAKEGKITLEYTGEIPTLEQIRLASRGAIDAIIRTVAVQNKAIFITSDIVQSEVARAKGLEVTYLYPEKEVFGPLSIQKFFTDDTMFVLLKARVRPMAKRGTVGRMRLVKIRDQPCTEKELREISHEILERAKSDPDGFIEFEKRGVTIVQLGSMRIAIASPPFSDGMEITAVRPIAKVTLDEYRFCKELKARLVERQRGILVAGSPGTGKSTFAACVAEFLQKSGHVVKTMESPRDLQISDEITQYAPLENDMAATADILLLVRPDYTIYDELRKTSDFRVFADMRLAGVGMVGVVHSNRAIDAVQRLIGRVELGIIPQIVDTVVFIDMGEISKVYDLMFKVKVPNGMVEEDLARPIIDVVDFESGRTEYEIYSYGDQVVVMPVDTISKPAWSLAEKEIYKVISKYARGHVDVLMISDGKAIVYLDEQDIPRIIGKGGKNIDRIEGILGISIDVCERED